MLQLALKMHTRLLKTFEAATSCGDVGTARKQFFRSQRQQQQQQQQHASERSAHVRPLMITDASSVCL